MGYALESYHSEGVGSIQFFINPGWYDPGFLVDPEGDASQIEPDGTTTKITTKTVEAVEGLFDRITVAVAAVFEKMVAKTAQIASAVIDTLRVGELQLDASSPKPICDAEARGKIWFVEGDSGVADAFEVCAKDVGDAYAWRTIY